MINGQLAKGLVVLGAGMAISAVTCGSTAPVLWILSAVDAYQCAKKLRSGMVIRKFQFFKSAAPYTM